MLLVQHFLDRIREGERKTSNEWGKEFFSDIKSKTDRRNKVFSLCTSLRKRKKNRAFIYAKNKGGVLVDIETEENLSEIFSRSKSRIQGSFRYMIGASEKLELVKHKEYTDSIISINESLGYVKNLLLLGSGINESGEYEKK